MADLTGNTLLVLVQVLHEKIKALQRQISLANPEDEGLADLEEELMSLSISATELRAAYELEATTAGNLPPYSELVSER